MTQQIGKASEMSEWNKKHIPHDICNSMLDTFLGIDAERELDGPAYDNSLNAMEQAGLDLIGSNWFKRTFTQPAETTIARQSALLAQMAAALKELRDGDLLDPDEFMRITGLSDNALTAYRTLSPDPQWQRVPDANVIGAVALQANRDFDAEGWKLKDCKKPRSEFVGEAIVTAILKRARGEG